MDVDSTNKTLILNKEGKVTQLSVYLDTDPNTPLIVSRQADTIKTALAEGNVLFDQWQSNIEVKAGDSQEVVINAYKDKIESLKSEMGFTTVDVVSLNKETPDLNSLRQKFLQEHTHTENEIRLFVQGQGLFYLHIGQKVYGILCQKGDLLSVPAGTPHWFDFGESPNLVAIRFFEDPTGWIAHYTGKDIANHFEKLEVELEDEN